MNDTIRPLKGRRCVQALRLLCRCVACKSELCYCRIHCDDPWFDEVACRDHVKELERLADDHLGNPGATRTHVTSSSPVKRSFPGENARGRDEPDSTRTR